MKKKEIRNYIITEKLGTGSYGVVYLVYRKDQNQSRSQEKQMGNLNFMNAVKDRPDREYFVLKQISLFGLSKKESDEVKEEAKLLASFNNKYIVKYIESFIEENSLYIVMEYCDGGDLSQFIKNQKGKGLTDDIIWRIFIQTCLGIYYLHQRKILHRDVKSLNIFMNKQGNIKLGDLGVAKVLSTSFANTFVGTPYYLSPEMCEEKPYNEKSDIWAIGCILYELVTYKHPFNAMNQGALIMKIIKGKYDSLPLSTSQDIKKLIEIILEKNSTKRPYIYDILKHSIIINKSKQYGLYEEIKETGIINEDLAEEGKGELTNLIIENGKEGRESKDKYKKVGIINNNIKSKSGFSYNFFKKEKEEKGKLSQVKSELISQNKNGNVGQNFQVYQIGNNQVNQVKSKSKDVKNIKNSFISNNNYIENRNNNSKLKLNIPMKYSEIKVKNENESLVNQIMGIKSENEEKEKEKENKDESYCLKIKKQTNSNSKINIRPLFKEPPCNINTDGEGEVNIVIRDKEKERNNEKNIDNNTENVKNKEKDKESIDYLDLIKPKKIKKKKIKKEDEKKDDRKNIIYYVDKYEDISEVSDNQIKNNKNFIKSDNHDSIIFDDMLKSIKNHSFLQNKVLSSQTLAINEKEKESHNENKNEKIDNENNDDDDGNENEDDNENQYNQYDEKDEDDKNKLVNSELDQKIINNNEENEIYNDTYFDINTEEHTEYDLNKLNLNEKNDDFIKETNQDSFIVYHNEENIDKKSISSKKSNFTNVSNDDSFKYEVSYSIDKIYVSNQSRKINVFESNIQDDDDEYTHEETVNITIDYAGNMEKNEHDKRYELLIEIEELYGKIEDFLIFYNNNQEDDDVLDKVDLFVYEEYLKGRISNDDQEKVKILMKKYIVSDSLKRQG